MTFESIRQSGGSSIRRTICPASGISFRIQRSRKNSDQLSLTIGPALLKECRWRAGDRVDIRLDVKASLGLVCRVLDDGWKVSTAGGKGKPSRAVVKTTCRKEVFATLFPNGEKNFIPEAVRLDDEGILFDLPTP